MKKKGVHKAKEHNLNPFCFYIEMSSMIIARLVHYLTRSLFRFKANQTGINPYRRDSSDIFLPGTRFILFAFLWKPAFIRVEIARVEFSLLLVFKLKLHYDFVLVVLQWFSLFQIS